MVQRLKNKILKSAFCFAVSFLLAMGVAFSSVAATDGTAPARLKIVDAYISDWNLCVVYNLFYSETMQDLSVVCTDKDSGSPLYIGQVTGYIGCHSFIVPLGIFPANKNFSLKVGTAGASPAEFEFSLNANKPYPFFPVQMGDLSWNVSSRAQSTVVISRNDGVLDAALPVKTGDSIRVFYYINGSPVSYDFTAITVGDMDFDSSVTAADALMVLNFSIGKINFNDYQNAAAQLSGIPVDSALALRILQRSISLVDAI